ncbi:hypothetical protein GTR02_18040 [Kineococcus sp. R8]|nr:hypothetical protein [Kineococcus siccus]
MLGVFLSATDTAGGWIVPPGTLLPDAVVGATTGRARVEAVLRDQFWIRVDRDEAVLQPAGAAVKGTSLTFEGFSDETFSRWVSPLKNPRTQVFFSDGPVTSFGRFGGGEVDGVAF